MNRSITTCVQVCSLIQKTFKVKHLAILVLAMLALPFLASAQNSTIVGTVTDPSDAAIANVKVTVTNTETHVSKVYTTNDSGQYVAADLNVGHYDIRAEAAGFKAVDQKDFVLQVGDRARIDFKMTLGAAQETVTVEANEVKVQSDTGEVSNVITDQQIAQLSTNGRSIYTLSALTPGSSSKMADSQVNTPVGGDASVEFNGMRQNHNIYLLDGGEDDDRGGAGGMSIAPSTDAIAEFRALTSNYSADYGLSSAGTMTLVLKSGTSQFHASAWEFLRNDALDARNYFNPVPQKVAELRVNVYGFNVGGPVTFGKLYNPSRTKTFFFYNMEWRSWIQGGVYNQTVPDPSTYGGNFGATTIKVPSAAQVSPGVLFANCPGGTAPTGVVQGSAFPSNTIPSCMIAPNATALLNAGIFPAPNVGEQFQGGAKSPTNVREEIVRIDHNFNSKWSIFGHFVDESVSQNYGESLWSGANVPTATTTFGNPSYSGVVHLTTTISPTLLNEFAFNYNGNRINIVPEGVVTAPSAFTFNRLFTGPNNLSRIPNIDLNGSIGTHYELASWPWYNKADDYQIRDDISLTHGAHQIKFGGSWALYKKVQDLFGQTQGGFGFDGTYTGNDFADYLLGDAKTYQELAVQDKGYWNNVSWALYVQDNWRVNKRLTLNLGLRWDGVPHTYEANNRMGNFYPGLYNAANAATFNTNGTICAGPTDPGCTATSPGLGTSPNSILAGVPLYLNGIGIPGQDGVPKGLVNNHWAAFGPRLGFAYDLTGQGKTVIRGGFGIMYERIQGNDMYNAGPNIPFSLQVNLNSVTLANPSISLASGTKAVQPINAASITGLALDNYKLPESYQWSIGVQHQLLSKTIITASYVGNVGRHQNDYRNINLPSESALPELIAGGKFQLAPGLPYPGFTAISQSENEANTHYNGLQVDLNSQIGRDLNFRAFYTLSKAVDPTTAGGGGGDLGAVSNPYAGWQYDNGPSGYDRRNVFLLNFIYDIPVFRNSENKFLKTVVGGWQLSGIVTMESGTPINIGLTGGQSGNGLPTATNRPDVTGSIVAPHTVNAWITSSAFALPALGAWGNLGHNAVYGPGRDNWNLSLFKSFVLSESRGSRIEFRAESFNTWNHTQFNAVSSNFGASNFGAVTSAFDPRIFQFGLKVYY